MEIQKELLFMGIKPTQRFTYIADAIEMYRISPGLDVFLRLFLSSYLSYNISAACQSTLNLSLKIH